MADEKVLMGEWVYANLSMYIVLQGVCATSALA
jgi:hypothetical protein